MAKGMVKFLPGGAMGIRVRAMTFDDIPQAEEIEREAFPTQWPTPFRRELQNKIAHYLVAYEEISNPTPPAPVTGEESLLARMKGLFRKERFFTPLTPSGQFILGLVGFWVLYDEAHIITIAVREAYRRRGIGELLLVAAIEKALRHKAQVVTLEVRVSNLPAQALYEKYGFRKTGIRRGYYPDNGEDGYIMSTETITSAPFQANFQRLKELYTRKWNRPIEIED